MTKKNALYVCLSPLQLPLYEVEKSAVVVIDILRATTTMTAALANGAKQVIPVYSVETCKELGRKKGAVTAGEREGKIIGGLDKGNSPFEYTDGSISGKTLVITTTNGTKLIEQALSLQAKEIILGSFLTLSALAKYIQNLPYPILLVCAGWKDKINIEDMLFAGALSGLLKKSHRIDCDSALIAMDVYEKYKEDMFEIIPKTSHYRRLDKFNLSGDLGFCFQKDVYNIVPIYADKKIIVK